MLLTITVGKKMKSTSRNTKHQILVISLYCLAHAYSPFNLGLLRSMQKNFNGTSLTLDHGMALGLKPVVYPPG